MAKRFPHSGLLLAGLLAVYVVAAGLALAAVDRSVGQIKTIRMMSMFELAVHSSLLRGEADLYLATFTGGADRTDQARLSNRVATRVANIAGLLARVRSLDVLDAEVAERIERLRVDLGLLKSAGGVSQPEVAERFRQQIITTVQTLQHAAEHTITHQTEALDTFSGWTRELTAILAGIGLVVLLLVYNLHAKNRQLLVLNNQDALTGLSSRRHAHQQGLLHTQAARADGTALCLAVIDIDHFKAVNDRYGHLVGDQVIRRVADALAGLPGAGKLAARMGGEEFLVLWPRTDVGTATSWCAQLQAGLAGLDQDLLPKVTVSIGLAAGQGAEVDFDRLYHMADEALYVAKRRGRDGIAFYGEADLIHTVARPPLNGVADAEGPDLRRHEDLKPVAGHKVA